MNRVTKLLAIGLVVSVTLNAFLLGSWAGRFVRGGHPGGDHPMMWKSHRAQLEPHREAVERAKRAVREALLTEPFVPEKLEATLGELRAQTSEAQLALHRAVVEMSRDLSVEDRRRLADARWFVGSGGGGKVR